MSGAIRKAWESPTLNTWASFLSRTLGQAVLLPILLQRWPANDFNVWALFSTLAGLTLLIDMGFSVTLVRAIAVTLAGASGPESFARNAEVTGGRDPNWALLGQVLACMRWIYGRLGWIYLVIIGGAGAAALWRPIALVDDPLEAWLAWGVVLTSGILSMRYGYHSILLQGLNQISVLRRWEAITGIGAATSSIAVALLGGDVLAVVMSQQGWFALGLVRNRWLTRTIAEGRFRKLPRSYADRAILRQLWPPTWRSGIAVLASFGLVQSTGLFYAQMAPPEQSAQYLLCLRILQVLNGFAQAPFYSRLPMLARLRAEGRRDDLIALAARGMSGSLWALSLSFALVGLLGPHALEFIRSNVSFPSAPFWVTMGLMSFVERFAAMHLQLYSTTNHIVSHVANGVTALLALAAMFVLVPVAGGLGLSLGLAFGYLAFYSWYPVWHSHREFQLGIAFERRTSFGPFVIFLVGASLACLA